MNGSGLSVCTWPYGQPDLIRPTFPCILKNRIKGFYHTRKPCRVLGLK